MKEDTLSMRQLLAMTVTALIAIALRQLPGRSAQAAQGAGAWLSALVALPAVLLLCWALSRLFMGLPEHWGYGEALRGVLGPVTGRALTLIYMVWLVLILGSGLAQCGERLSGLGYSGIGRGIFLLAALALAVRMALGRIDAFARAVEVFFLILTAALVFVLLLALFRVEGNNLLPVTLNGGLLRGAFPALQVACAAVPATYLLGWVQRLPRPEGSRKLIRWTVWSAVVLTVVQLVCIGAYGWQITSLQRVPLFEAARQVGISGAFQRVEAVVAALLVMSDVALFGLALYTLCAMGRSLSHAVTARRVAPAAAVLSGGVAFLMLRNASAAQFLGEFLLPCLGICLGFFAPLVVLFVKRLRRLGQNGNISCAGEETKAEYLVVEKKGSKTAKKKQKKC